METTYHVFSESDTLSNAGEEGQRVDRGLHVSVATAPTRHGLARNARRKHRRHERDKKEAASRWNTTKIHTAATAATASTSPVVPLGGGGRRRCVVVGTVRHSE